MGKYRLYIADSDEGFISRVRAVASRSQKVEVVGHSSNGGQALKDIVRLTPDVLLTDIPLPELDGIALLRESQRLRRPPAVIVCTRFCSEACMRCASRYGASFFLCKPMDLQVLPALIEECARCAEDALPRAADPREEGEAHYARAVIARNLLKELGLSPRLDGCAYILKAATHFYGDELLLRNLTRGLYARIAARMDTTVSRVERSIRCAVAIAYDRGTLGSHFQRKPTNLEFLRFVFNRIDQAAREEI